MTLSDKLQKSLSIELEHYINCNDNNTCERCIKLVNDMLALKLNRQ